MMTERRVIHRPASFLPNGSANNRRRQDDIFEERSHTPASDHRRHFGNTGRRLSAIAAPNIPAANTKGMF